MIIVMIGKSLKGISVSIPDHETMASDSAQVHLDGGYGGIPR